MSDGSSSVPATVKALQAALAHRDAELAQLKGLLNQKDAALAEKDAALTRQASQIAKMKELVLESLPEELIDELEMAILNEDVEEINMLLVDEGVQFVVDDISLNDGFTPLAWACYNDRPKAVDALLAKGANVEVKGYDGSTPLIEALRRCPGAVPMLLAKGVNVEAVLERTKDRPLHLARTVEAAQALVQAGADLNPRNSQGETPLLFACLRRRATVVRFLLEQLGTDANAKDKYGHSAIHHAATSNSEKLMEAVLACPRVDIMAVDDEGDTALHLAAMSSSGRIVQPLLPHFDDVNVKNNDGRTPLELATKGWSHPNIIALLEAGAVVKSFFKDQLLEVLEPFVVDLYRNPTAPLPAYRRTLRWAMTSRVVEATLPSIHAKPAADASKREGAGNKAALPDDIDDAKNLRLALSRQDAWKRRGHLVFDRAMTIREAEKEGEA